MWYRGENRAPRTVGRKRRRNRDGGGDGREDGYGNGHENRDEDGNLNGSGRRSRNESGNGSGNGSENGRESLGTYEVVIEVDRKTRESRRRQRVTSNHICKTRRPSKTVASR